MFLKTSDLPIKTKTFNSFWILFFLIAAIALALRLYRINSQPLWLDETYSAWFSAIPLHNLWHDVPRYETHPPFYYTLLKGWTSIFGMHEGAMRMLSVFISLITLLLISLSGQLLDIRIFSKPATLLAGLFFALNYGAVDYSRQARPYALETFLVTASIFLSLKLLQVLTTTDDSLRRRRNVLQASVGLGAAAGCTLWTHNTAVFVMLGIWSGMIIAVIMDGGRRMQEKILAIGGAGLLALVIWAPFLPMLVVESKAMAAMSFWVKFQLSDVQSAGFLLAGGRRGLEILSVLAVLYGLYRLLRVQKILAVHIACVMVVPMAAMIALSLVSRPVFLPRLFEWMSPMICLLMAAGLMQMNVKKLRWAVPVLAVLIAGMLAVSDYRFFKEPKEDWPELLSFIGAHAHPGDIVIAIPNEIGVPLAYYLSAAVVN